MLCCRRGPVVNIYPQSVVAVDAVMALQAEFGFHGEGRERQTAVAVVIISLSVFGFLTFAMMFMIMSSKPPGARR